MNPSTRTKAGRELDADEPDPRDCPLAHLLATSLRERSREITARWLARIAARVAMDPNRVFPTDELLNHVPLLIEGIATYLEDPAREISTDTPVVAKAMELGQLRHAQGFDAYEILKEYEILGGILFVELSRAANEAGEPCAKGDLLTCGHRVFRALSTIQQTTTTQFLALADERVAEREDRLRAFNRSVSHEIKNRIGAVLGASELLQSIPDLPPDRSARLLRIVSDNAVALKDTVENLIALSRTDTDARQHRHVRLPEAAREALRQVREAAAEAGVDLRVRPDVADVEVNAAAVELCLTNYLTNAIKYADGGKTDRYAEVSASIEETADGRREVIVRVRDNGLGVPEDKRGALFRRFFRAHETVTGAAGTGLGLSIVRDTAEALGGHAWAEFLADGSMFLFSLPYRRGERADATQGSVEPQP